MLDYAVGTWGLIITLFSKSGGTVFESEGVDGPFSL